jgi:hypothetical protein
MESKKKASKNEFSTTPWRVALLKLNLVTMVLQYFIGMTMCYVCGVDSTASILLFGIIMAVSGGATIAFYMNFNKKSGFDYNMTIVALIVTVIATFVEFYMWLDTDMSIIYAALISWEKAVTLFQTFLVWNYLYYQEYHTWKFNFNKTLQVTSIADFRIEYQKLEICRMVIVIILLTSTVIFAID